VPEPDEPALDELTEIGRRVCNLLGVKPGEPVTASRLRRIADKLSASVPRERWSVVYALRICADAMAAHELPAEVRELREVIDAHAHHLLQSEELRERVRVALEKAIPVLDREAALRAQALDTALTDDERRAGAMGSIWPSPEALLALPRELLGLLPDEPSTVGRLQKVLHDLTLVDADARIVAHFAPTNIRMAKALKQAGISVADIASALKPFAKDGPARKQARNTVQGYLKSKSEDTLRAAYRVPPDAPNRAQQLQELEEAARRVVGFGGTDIRPVVASTSESIPERDELGISDSVPKGENSKPR
jgi:hypothetical protein